MIVSSNMAASDSQWEAMIIEKMLLSMTGDKNTTIYTQDKQLKSIVNKLAKINMTDDCEKADFILSDIASNKSCKKPEIVFNYRKYRNKTNAIGVFFWQKGRPTIRFSPKRLKYFGLHVSGELSKFVSSYN